MSRLLALKVRLYPTSNQAIFLNKTFGCCRKIYNELLSSRQQYYLNNIAGKNLTKKDRIEIWKQYKAPTEKELKEQFSYLKEVSSVALQQSRRDLESAFSNFFNGSAKAPKFHSKKQKNSFRELRCKFNWYNRRIILPKIGEIKFKNRKLPIWLNLSEAKLHNITVSKTPSNQYYASVLFEVETTETNKLFNDENQVIGLDFSPQYMYIDSFGGKATDYGYIAQKQIHHKKLRKLQRRFARTKKDSNNREKMRIKLARLEQHIANARRDWIEKESLRLLKSYQVICLETLSIKGLMRASKNAHNYVDVSWGSFSTKLLNKSERFSSIVILADRFFPSSKLCSSCGHKMPTMKLSVRNWQCPICKAQHNRDINAAKNLKQYAINLISNSTQGS